MSNQNNLEIEKLINIVCAQTNYGKEEALYKLEIHGFDYMKVIREYVSSSKKKEEIKNPVKSLNQEIYKQIRYKLDESSLQYSKNNPIKIDQVISNFKESEIKKNNY